MTTNDIAERLVALCRQGNFEAAHKELYAPDAINIEPYGTAKFAKETRRPDLCSTCKSDGVSWKRVPTSGSL